VIKRKIRYCDLLWARNIGTVLTNTQSEVIIMWTKPEYSDMRFGFEVTMYICNR